MEPVTIPFGSWRPDVPGLAIAAGGSVRRASGCWPVDGGYRAAPRRTVQNTVPIPPLRSRGGIGGITFDGSSYNFIGTAAKLYRISPSTLTDKSKGGGSYSLATNDRWEFEVFGNFVFAATPSSVLQYLDLANLASGSFADVTSGPQARFVKAIRNHLFVGNLLNEPNAVQCSAIGTPTSWPTPGTDPAIAVQSGKFPLGGPGGHVMGLVGGAETGAVFQERAIWRLDYVGGDVIWDPQRVEPSRGLLVPGGAVDFGREVFFLSQDGFFRFNYTSARPVGQEQVNRYVLDQLDRQNYDRVRMAVVPASPLVAVAFPGAGSVGGLPNRLLFYNWALDRFTIIDDEECDALYRWQPWTSGIDDPPDENIDTASGSYDDAETILGEQRLAFFNTALELGTLDGPGREFVIETGLVSLVPNLRTTVSRVRPLVENVDARAAIAGVSRSQDAIAFGPERDQLADGSVPLMKDARFHVFRVHGLEGDNGQASGLEVEFRPSGTR